MQADRFLPSFILNKVKDKRQKYKDKSQAKDIRQKFRFKKVMTQEELQL